ncbi:MAG: VWA domain-containing protein, partial [Chloroflexi bacterium]|nr:VWA domain-containing protein [Chloroflexota bacterium]
IEAMSGKDFSAFDGAALDEVARLAALLVRRLARRKSRRLKPSHRRGRVDLRRTMRLSLTRGEPIELPRRRRKILKTKLVVLCDVSGSMDLYSRLLVQFLYALQNQLGRMETFVFSTRLHRVTDELRGQTYGAALARLGDVRDWSGGTKIGESLSTFTLDWRRLLDRDTVAVILSDGWDTGDPAALGEAMATIHRRAAKVIWLNPLLGSPDYQPLTQGMIAALPYVDAFLPAHNLESLRALARHLRP